MQSRSAQPRSRRSRRPRHRRWCNRPHRTAPAEPTAGHRSTSNQSQYERRRPGYSLRQRASGAGRISLVVKNQSYGLHSAERETSPLAGGVGREVESLALGLVAVVVSSETTLPHSACAVAGTRVPPLLSSRTEDELAHPLRQGALLTRRARSFAV
jgi:hypothetical protein